MLMFYTACQPERNQGNELGKLMLCYESQPIQCFILIYLLLFKLTSGLQMQPNMLVVGLLAVYPQTQTMQATDEKRDVIEVENGGPALEK